MTDACITTDRWLEPSAADRRHVNECASCAELARELDMVRAHAAALDPSGWAGELAPDVDVEAALSSVLGRADFIPARPRRPLFVQIATTLAAAVLLFSVAAPSLLRWRVETVSHDQAARGVPMSGVFWTTDRRP